MKTKLVGFLAITLLLTQCQEKYPKIESKTIVDVSDNYASADYQFTTQADTVSYLLAQNMANVLAQQIGGDLDKEILIKGIMVGLKQGSVSILKDTAVQNFMRTYSVQMQAEKQKEDLAAGEEFLTSNATKEGVKTTASGLQYKVIKKGTGAKPTTSSTVKCNYKGMLTNGTVFDQGEGATFGVTQVIKGWTEALQMMKVGAEWELYIPANLAYGANSPTPAIPPNSVLIFEIKLLDIVK